MLSDRSIRKQIEEGNLVVSPVSLSQLQPVSIDLRLGAVLSDTDTSPWHGDYTMKPQEFILGSTYERVRLGNNLVGQVHGKSTRARQGLIVHAAGLVDPGFEGQLTLEMFNMSSEPIFLKQLMLIAQISFEHVSCTPERPYGHPDLNSHYQGQRGPTRAARL